MDNATEANATKQRKPRKLAHARSHLERNCKSASGASAMLRAIYTLAFFAALLTISYLSASAGFDPATVLIWHP